MRPLPLVVLLKLIQVPFSFLHHYAQWLDSIHEGLPNLMRGDGVQELLDARIATSTAGLSHVLWVVREYY
ncbi:MAG: hypothetical protein ABIP71_06440, partial [Verrucomicrobiota bacterium]